MFTPNPEIKFDTYIEGNIFEIQDIYAWSLYRYIGYKEKNPFFFASFVKPVEDFSNGISAEHIISKLNEGNIFDFDYTPQEKDTLHISFNAKNRREYKYFELIFRDNIWQTGCNPRYVSVTEKIAEGEVKVLYSGENSFLKQCEEIKTNYGLEIPESIKVKCLHQNENSSLTIFQAIKNFNGYKVFFNPDFIEYMTEQYYQKFPNEENSNILQSLVDKAQTNFSLLEKKFISEKVDFSFINECLTNFGSYLKCLFIAIPLKEDGFIIINGRLHLEEIISKGKRKTHFINKAQKLNYEVFSLKKYTR